MRGATTIIALSALVLGACRTAPDASGQRPLNYAEITAKFGKPSLAKTYRDGSYVISYYNVEPRSILSPSDYDKHKPDVWKKVAIEYRMAMSKDHSCIEALRPISLGETTSRPSEFDVAALDAAGLAARTGDLNCRPRGGEGQEMAVHALSSE